MSILNKAGSLLSPNKLAQGAEIRKKEKNVKGLVKLIDKYVRENELCFTEMALAFTTMTEYFRRSCDTKHLLIKRDDNE